MVYLIFGLVQVSLASRYPPTQISFGKVHARELKVEVGGCGVPDEGGYPLTFTDVVVRHVEHDIAPSDGELSVLITNCLTCLRRFSQVFTVSALCRCYRHRFRGK